MKKILLLTGLACISLISCRKEFNCSNGELCVKNAGNSTIHYSFGSSLYTDSLTPGQSACTEVGKIKTRPWGGSSSVVYFNSDHGSYYFEVTRCHQVEEVR